MAATAPAAIPPPKVILPREHHKPDLPKKIRSMFRVAGLALLFLFLFVHYLKINWPGDMPDSNFVLRVPAAVYTYTSPAEE